MKTVLEALTGAGGARLVGLVGDSGSGKTTTLSEIVRSIEVREAFSDGIACLTVNDGGKDRLPALMLQLARMFFEDIGGSVGRRPIEFGDSTSYIQQRVKAGHGGKGLKCLVVADNEWEKEAASRILETGVWVLLSTRDEALVTRAHGTAVRVDKLSEADAKSVLRWAAELRPGFRLPDHALELIEMCGRVAMDVAFVGRWSIVRGRQDQAPWSDAARKVRDQMQKVGEHAETFSGKHGEQGFGGAQRRKAILRAGFDDLATGVDDRRVQELKYTFRLPCSRMAMPSPQGMRRWCCAIDRLAT